MKTLKKLRTASWLLALILTVMTLAPVPSSAAEATVNLGSTVNFAVLAGETITNTGSTTIDGTFGGDIGLDPGSSITGFPPGTVGGVTHKTDATALQAKNDLVLAYDDAKSRTVTQVLTGTDLGGLTLKTGVYFFASSAQLTGTLILDAEGDPNAVFIFQIGSALTTATNSEVRLINGARFCRVFWQVTSSATIGTTTKFAGHIFALTSITANTGATIEGQLLARNGSVTLDSNTITNGFCETITSSSSSSSSSQGGTLPDTSTPWYSILIAGAAITLIAAFALRSKKSKG